MVDQRPWQSAKEAAHQLAEESIGPGPREDPAANGGAHSLFDRDEVGAPKLASPNQELMVQIDLHRTDVAARAAQRGCERQAGVGGGTEVWRQHRANRSGNGNAIAVSAASAVHRAGIHASAAANTMQRSAVLVALQNSGAAVVDNDDVQLATRTRAVEVGSIGGDWLPGSRSREKPEKDCEVLRPRDDFFNPHAGDVQRRKRGAQIRVSLVGANDETTGLRNGEIHSGDSGLSAEELLAQVLPRQLGQRLRIRHPCGSSQLLVEKLTDLFLLEMNGRHDDVTGGLAPKLHDALPEVGVHHFDAVQFQIGIEMALLGEHRLALHDAPNAARGEDGVHDAIVLFSAQRPMNLRPERYRFFLEVLEVIRQTRE